MTGFERYFLETIEQLDSYGVPYFIHGGTLLGLIRDKKLLNRPDVVSDREFNFGMMAEDYTPEFYEKLHRDNLYFEPGYSGLPNMPPVLTFFSRFKMKGDGSRWNLPAFSLMTLFFTGRDKVIEYMGRDCGLTWDKEHFDKSKWETIEFMDKKIKTPYKVKKFFTRYYGKDWMVEDKKWHFYWNSHNFRSFKKILKNGELNLKNYKFRK